MSNFVNRLIGTIARYSDIALVALIIFVIVLMIIPLPTGIIDLLIGINLALSITVIMIALYIPSAISFASFPSLLLFTTLFRLGLNIATTRLILLYADAGEIISTFGEFVVGGNLVVGGVIFLIIIIVQFLVISKGTERVSEVSARFTLDAMPGKQMSVDSDMRAGSITMDEAKVQRENVQLESQLYGAMDGAMKFVKGDTIANLIITALNILGGIGIGVLQRGMSAEAALSKYAILTVGNGLVNQIPSLLISISAGIIVTRVSGAESKNLGDDMTKQFMSQPKALMTAGGIIFLFALVPGFPKAQLFALGGLMVLVGYGLGRALNASPEDEAAKQLSESLAAATDTGKTKEKKKTQEAEGFSIAVPVLVDLASDIRARIDTEVLNDEVIRLRRALYYDLGVPFPGINLRYADDMESGHYVIRLDEVPATRGWLRDGCVLAREKAEHLRVLGIDFSEDKTFLPGLPTLWVPETETKNLDRLGVSWFDPAKTISYHLSFALKKHASNFIGIQETRHLLSQMEGQYPELVKEAQRVLSLQKMAVQRLVQENVSIRNFRSVLEAFIEWGPKEKDSLLLTEYVRGALKRQISYQYAGENNQLPVYLVHPDGEEKIRAAVRQTSSGSFLALDPQSTAQFLKNLKTEVGDLDSMPHKPVMLTSMDIRRYVRKLIEGDFAELMVLSYQELTPEITVQPLGKVAL